MIRKLLAFVAFGTLTAFGVTVDTTNTRPVVIGTPPGSEASLQTILNGIYGCTDCVDANSNQSTAGMFSEPGTPPQQVAPIIQATYTADGDAIGLFSGTSTTGSVQGCAETTSSCNGLALLDLFTNTAPNDASASVRFNAGGQIVITDTTGGASCAADGVNCGTFNGSGINQSDFGFYENNGTVDYYSADNLNPTVTPSFNAGTTAPAGYSTDARAVAYDGPGNKWAIAFEDGTDFDYNDRVLSVESIVPAVPEPSSVLLLGGALLLGAGSMRRKLRKS
jgi:hypothetical protein